MTANRVRWPLLPRAVGATALAAVVSISACRMSAQESWAACARIQASVVDECSGIVESRRHPGVFWVHNDSGDSARFFGVDRRGGLLVEVEVDGARNVDWEDIAVDDSGRVYLGDFGNNYNKRRDLLVYVVDEPDPNAGGALRHIPVRRRLPFRFPDQHAFPDSTAFNFDCEAMFWADGRVWMMTKHRSDLRTTLYRLDMGRTDEQPAERIGEVEIGSPVTAADCSPDGRLLAVLSYQYIHLFAREGPGASFLAGRSHRTLIEGRQCEGLCLDGERVMYTNEQREIYCVSIGYLWTHDRYFPEPPRVAVPRVEPQLDGRALEWREAEGRLAFDRYVEVPGRLVGVSPSRGAAGAAAAESLEVRVGWSTTGLLVHASWRDRYGGERCAGPAGAPAPTGYFMLGLPGSGRPCLESSQAVWAVVPEGDSLVLRPWPPESGQPPCAPPAPGPQPQLVTRHPRRGRTELEAVLAVPGAPTLEAGGEVLLGVQLLEPACGGGAAEFGWSATLDMQPLGNPLLWGRARLEPGVSPGG